MKTKPIKFSLDLETGLQILKWTFELCNDVKFKNFLLIQFLGFTWRHNFTGGQLQIDAQSSEGRAVARTLIGGGGGVYSYIQVLPD